MDVNKELVFVKFNKKWGGGGVRLGGGRSG